MGKIHSVPGVFGGEDFYDESGKKIGDSSAAGISMTQTGNPRDTLRKVSFPAKISMMKAAC